MSTLDPDQDQPHRRLRDLLRQRYRLLTPRCGPLIWVRADAVRTLPRLDC